MEIGTFQFKNNFLSEFTSSANHTRINDNSNSSCISFIPGKPLSLQIETIDDLNNTMKYSSYLINIVNNTSNISALNGYLNEDKKLTLKGKPGDEAVIKLSTLSSLRIVLSFKAKLLECPPGYVIPWNDINQCKCSFTEDKALHYLGITDCSSAEFRATTRNGIWVGYEENKSASEDTLQTGYCPLGFCRTGRQQLPKTADSETLSDKICQEHRMGVLCGECKENYSIYYHSANFRCGKNDLCHLGWVFYLLGEILPVTLTFIVILWYDISLTSGSVNGFIFFSQVVQILLIGAGRSIPSTPGYRAIKLLSNIHTFLYYMFQLEFFVTNEMSYCIWKNASTPAVLAVRYVTLLHALMLIISIILLIKYCNIRCALRRLKVFNLKQNFIRGLSAFLVLFYSQSAIVSIFLLRKENIYSKGMKKGSSVVYYYGTYKWLQNEHLPYAIPAIITIILVVILPPTLLLIYPLHYKMLSFLKLSESKFVLFIQKTIPIEKLKPFFDSFQGCFKDKYRFFSGLYFFYRLAILINLAVNELWIFYLTTEIQIVLMLIIHTLCQPYKKKLHNVIDSLLMGNLAFINMLTAYSSGSYIGSLHLSSWIKTILIFIPLVVFITAFAIKLLHSYKNKRAGGTQNEEELMAFESSPSGNDRECEYQEMGM